MRPKRNDELQHAIVRARALWEDLFRLMRTKDRYVARGLDTGDLERLMELRGVELTRDEALIRRLEAEDEAAPDWRGMPWASS